MGANKQVGDGKTYVLLHLLLILLSFSGVCSKMAAKFPFLSIPFCLYYAGMIAILGIYAIGWQQVIKRLPITVAYANRAMMIVWGVVWGALLFHEAITLGKLLGAAIVIAGILLYVKENADE